MEYPYGKPALVWLRSNHAFYLVKSVSSDYLNFWNPLKDILDLSGHAINTMLRSNAELLTPYMIKKIADLALLDFSSTIQKITSNRPFIIEQIKNQRNDKLLRYQFFKDLANAKTWDQLTTTMIAQFTSLNARAPADNSNGKDSKPPVSIASAKSRIKKTNEPGKSAMLKRSIGANSSGTSRKVSSVRKKIKERSSGAYDTPQMAKRTHTGLSHIGASLLVMQIPEENSFEYKCPFCCIKISKTSSMPKLLPRIQYHLREHGLGDSFENKGAKKIVSQEFAESIRALFEKSDEFNPLMSWPSISHEPHSSAEVAPAPPVVAPIGTLKRELPPTLAAENVGRSLIRSFGGMPIGFTKEAQAKPFQPVTKKLPFEIPVSGPFPSSMPRSTSATFINLTAKESIDLTDDTSYIRPVQTGTAAPINEDKTS